MNKIIGVTIGDIDGIGIELLIKLYKEKSIKNFILLTNYEIIKNYLILNKIKIKINIFNNKKYNNKCLNIYNFIAKNKIDNTYNSLLKSYELFNKNIIKGVVTLPLNKAKINRNIDNKFMGQTELYEKLDKKKKSNMIFVHKKLIITTLTNHIEFKDIIKNIKNQKKNYDKIKSLNNTLLNDFNILKPKIILSGLNPHAGESGRLGREEIKIFTPLIKKLNKNKINIYGPLSADSILINNNLKKFDCFVFNYHDQALIPFKIISNNHGVNFTGGLDIIRVSPDHGTAYDLIGKNTASTASLLESFKLLNKIYNNRSKIDKS